jgi:hypothetical protein
MNKKIFFLSHSSKDEDFVKKVANRLGEELCWLYQWEKKDTIFEFDKGIADSRVFVLFWSKNAASSQWVQEEISEARYRSIREKGYRLITIKLDNEPLPDYLAIRIYIDAEKGLEYIIEELNKLKTDLTSKEALFGKQDALEYFQNRQPELDLLDTLAFSGSHTGIIILGIDGMGKTALIRRSIYQLFSHLTPIWIDLRIASSPIRLLSSIAKPLSISIDLEEAGSNPEKFWSKKLFPEISLSEKTFIIFDNMGEVDNPYENQLMSRLIVRIIEDLIQIDKYDNPNMIIISQRMPKLSETALSKCGRIDISELDKKFVIRALRYNLSQISSEDFDYKKLDVIAENLNGYPLAIGLAATRISQHGIDVIIEDSSFIQRMFREIAEKLFSGIDISSDEKMMLTIISVSLQPLNTDQLKTIFKGKWTAISKLIDYQIVDSSSGKYQVHNILRAYILDAVSTYKEILEYHEILAKLFWNEWKKAPKKSAAKAQYGSLSYYHSISSGKSSNADTIKKEFLSEAMDAIKELYRRKQYHIALKYSESARKMYGGFEPIVSSKT